jgi:hypothetical protein
VIELKSNGELEAFKRCMKILSGKSAKDPNSLRGMIFLATRRLGNVTKQLVQRTYLQGSGIPQHTIGTQLTYAHGKAQGAERSHRMKFPDGRPAHRSGTLAKHVVVNKIGETHGHRVQIDPAKRYTGFGGQGDQNDIGKSLEEIASQLESPRPMVLSIPMTHRMRVYLMLLYRGEANADHTSKHHIMANYLTGKTLIVTRRPRPIWRDSFKKIMKAMPRELDKGLRVDFQRVHKLSRAQLGSAVQSLVKGGGGTALIRG